MHTCNVIDRCRLKMLEFNYLRATKLNYNEKKLLWKRYYFTNASTSMANRNTIPHIFQRIHEHKLIATDYQEVDFSFNQIGNIAIELT